jgi:hypothetical protein
MASTGTLMAAGVCSNQASEVALARWRGLAEIRRFQIAAAGEHSGYARGDPRPGFDVGTADRAALPSTPHWSGYGVNVWSIPLTHIAIGTSGAAVQQADPFTWRQPAVRRH